MSGAVLGPGTGHIRATSKPKGDRRARNLAGEIPPRNLAGRARSLARPARSRRAEVQGCTDRWFLNCKNATHHWAIRIMQIKGLRVSESSQAPVLVFSTVIF